MNPPIPNVLFEMAGLAIRNAAPDTPPAERASELGLSAAILAIAGEVWDRQAHILVEENRAIRVLLSEEGEDADLRLSVLKVENDRLRAALIQAHAAAEAAGDRERQSAIWAELVRSTERRRISSAPA
ncbi:MAG: hypothetical protein U1C74_25295 [Phenylobacterium sp.]|nr:hypothetical protein [Phenylobacterium sp.]